MHHSSCYTARTLSLSDGEKRLNKEEEEKREREREKEREREREREKRRDEEKICTVATLGKFNIN